MNILLVDDDAASRNSVAKFLRELGHYVLECENGESALEAFARGDYPMVMSDIRMPRIDGIQLMKAILNSPSGRNTDVVLFTGHGTMESAIEALRQGAYDYLLKPVNIEELAALTERIAEHQALRRENQVLTRHFEEKVQAETEQTREELERLKKLAAQSVGLSGIGLFSAQIREVMRQAQKYHTDRSIPVLIQGETGTGKEIFARMVHYGEAVIDAPFVEVNCAAITSRLFESELFGLAEGCFNGGLSTEQKGKIDLAIGGTLFLDEVGETPLDIQGKLLRVIQDKEFHRVGGLRKLKADIRVVCATNIDLEKAVERGSFRKDLYYRLKVGRLILPPLRERTDDILPLANMFLSEFSQRRGKQFTGISGTAAGMLKKYPWQGNVRELRNAIEWAVFMYDDILLKPEHLGIINLDKSGIPPVAESTAEASDITKLQLPAKGFSLEEHIDRIVCEALKMNNGNKTAAAQYLGISRRSLCYRLEQMEAAAQTKRC